MTVRPGSTQSNPAVARRLATPARHGAGLGRAGLASATLLVCLISLLGLTLARSHLAAQIQTPLARKLAASERVAYYLIDADAGPSFRVGPSDLSIELITHLLLPSSTSYDPEAEYSYAIVVSVRSLAGELVWQHELELGARQSKAEPDPLGWRLENAFLLGDDRQLTDDRLTRIRLPPGVEDRLVELRLAPRVPATGVRGLARVYVRRPRSLDDRSLRELSITPAAGRELIERLTYRGWDQLSLDERRVKLGQVWLRLAAEGEPGVDYETLTLFETGFRLPRGHARENTPLLVDRWRSLAINAVGPAELELRLLGRADAASSLDVHRLGLDGHAHSYPREPARVRRLSIPAGAHTLLLDSVQPLELELAVLDAGDDLVGGEAGEPERVWLVEAERAPLRDQDGRERLEPDRRRIEVVRVGAAWPEPPRWDVAGLGGNGSSSEDAAGRMFRFDVRVVSPVASSWWLASGPSPSLELCFHAANGAELGCETWTGQPSVGSRFEGLREVRADGGHEWLVVSDPQTLRLIAPREAVSVELRDPVGGADQRLLIRGYGYWPELETTLAEPFRSISPELARVRWRHPPLETRSWFPLRPSNHAALQRSLAITELLAQVRLEPLAGLADRSWWTVADPDLDDRVATTLAGEDGWDPGPWVTLEPRGRHWRRRVLERLDPDAARRLSGRWDPGLFTRLRADQPVLVDLSATGPEHPQLHWRVRPSALGRRVTVTIGERRYTRELVSTRGRWRLPNAHGRERVELMFDDPDTAGTFWIDRPVLFTPSKVSRRRVIHALRRELVFPLIKSGSEPVIVNVVVYIPRGRSHAALNLSVDGGAPERRTGLLDAGVSVSSRRFEIRPDAAYDAQGQSVAARERTRFADLDARQGPLLDVVTLQLTLGEDVAAGRHEVRLELLDPEPTSSIWVRAFHRGVGDRRGPAVSWSERRAEAPR